MELSLYLSVKLSYVIEFCINEGESLTEDQVKERVAALLCDRLAVSEGDIDVSDIYSVEVVGVEQC